MFHWGRMFFFVQNAFFCVSARQLSVLVKPVRMYLTAFFLLGDNLSHREFVQKTLQYCFGNEKHVPLKQCEANSFKSDSETASKLTVLRLSVAVTLFAVASAFCLEDDKE